VISISVEVCCDIAPGADGVEPYSTLRNALRYLKHSGWQRLSQRLALCDTFGLRLVEQKRRKVWVPLHHRCDLRLVCEFRMCLGPVVRGTNEGEISSESLERLLAKRTPHCVARSLRQPWLKEYDGERVEQIGFKLRTRSRNVGRAD